MRQKKQQKHRQYIKGQKSTTNVQQIQQKRKDRPTEQKHT